MNVDMHLTVCGVLGFFLVASFLYRKFIDDHDDHNIHLSNSASDIRTINLQTEHGKRIAMLDKINVSLAIVVLLYSVVIALMAAYTGWFATFKL